MKTSISSGSSIWWRCGIENGEGERCHDKGESKNQLEMGTVCQFVVFSLMIVAKPLEGNTDNANFSAFYVSRDFIIFVSVSLSINVFSLSFQEQ